MRNTRTALSAFLCLAVMLLLGCSGSNTPPAASRTADVWQNPYLSPNPNNNIHSDSYLSDTYAFAGPSSVARALVSQVQVTSIKDPLTGQNRFITLGECASQVFDAQGNIQTVCAGLPRPGTTHTERYVATIDRTTLQVLAIYAFMNPVSADGSINFGGAGYFYQDNQYRMVVAMPDGHVQVLRRTPSVAGGIDGYTVDADYNVTGVSGAVPVPGGLTSLDLYAVVPDKVGNIWFTTAQGVIGIIMPGNPLKISWLDLNDPTRTGQRQPQPDGAFMEIDNSHAVDEGDSANGPSGVYVVTTHMLYRLGAAGDGSPVIEWSAGYDRGAAQKPGQVSHGSGTSPTVFRMGNRRFVTIADNATYMNVNVYRAETVLQPGEQRLFAQIAPFGQQAEVSDENSLIVAPTADGTGVDIYAENNYGHIDLSSTNGSAMTKPGFARLRLKADGNFSVASLNSAIVVPSVVSKMSLASNIVYTYNKTSDGWYLTGLDADDLNLIRFTAKVGPGTAAYNNFYAGLSLDADAKTVWIGTVFGLTRIQLAE